MAQDRYTFDFHMKGKTQNAPVSGPPVVTTSSPPSGSPPWKTHSKKYFYFVLLFAWHIPSLLQNCLEEHSSRHRLVACRKQIKVKRQIMARVSNHISPGRSSSILWHTVDRKASQGHRNNLRSTSRRLEK